MDQRLEYHEHDEVGSGPHQHDDADCFIPTLPDRLQERAAELASRINPVNAVFTQFAMGDGGLEIARLAVLTSKYWGRQRRTLTVSFTEATPNDLRQRILGHMNAWSIGVTFALTAGIGHVRISRGGQGYWSYLGTDVLLIPRDRPTMNLQGFTMNSLESEYRRVVRHETGHTLGFPHEHLRRQLVSRLDPHKDDRLFSRPLRLVRAADAVERADATRRPVDHGNAHCRPGFDHVLPVARQYHARRPSD